MARSRNWFARAWWIWKPVLASPAMRRCWGRNWRGERVASSQFPVQQFSEKAFLPSAFAASIHKLVLIGRIPMGELSLPRVPLGVTRVPDILPEGIVENPCLFLMVPHPRL